MTDGIKSFAELLEAGKKTREVRRKHIPGLGDIYYRPPSHEVQARLAAWQISPDDAIRQKGISEAATRTLADALCDPNGKQLCPEEKHFVLGKEFEVKTLKRLYDAVMAGLEHEAQVENLDGTLVDEIPMLSPTGSGPASVK